MFGLIGRTPYIKVCGVTHTEDVELCAREGVHMVGMVLTPGYARSVETRSAVQLASDCRAVQIVPVYVLVQPNDEEPRQLLQALGPGVVQVHGRTISDRSIPHISVSEVNLDGQADSYFASDAVLYDRPRYAMERAFPYEKFIRPSGQFVGIAGGLSPETVGEAIQAVQPDWVDVSSGVCGEDPRRKDPRKIEEFIQKVRGAS